MAITRFNPDTIVRPKTTPNYVQQQSAGPQPAGAPASPPPAPVVPPEQRVKSDFDSGMSFAKEQIKDGSLGRLNDPRAADMQSLLDREKSGMSGMTPQEMQAAREQGNAEINRTLSGNLRQLGGIAAANGVRGGAAAGLQMGAVNQATMAQGDLQRKLILDNLNQKNIATDRYGNQLGNQQGVELGVNKYNNDQGNKEQLGQLGLGMQYGGLIDSYRTSDKSDALSQRGMDINEKALDVLQKASAPGAGQGGSGTPGMMSPAEARNSFINDPANSKMSKDQINGYLDRPENKFAQANGYATWTDLPDPLKKSPEGLKALGTTNSTNLTDRPNFTDSGEESAYNQYLASNPGLSDADKQKLNAQINQQHINNPNPAGIGPDGKANQIGCVPGVRCFVMTAAADSGLLDREFYNDTVTRCPTKRTNGRAYGVWGPLLAKAMQRSTALGKAISWLIPDVVKVLRGDPARVRGTLAYYGLYVPLCWLSKAYLKIKEPA